MSERGTIVIDRGVFGHDRLADERFTEVQAWIWMIGQAAFRPHCKTVSSVRVTLRRGEFAHSIRFMAEKWQWSPTAVRRFLEKIGTEIDGDPAMIGTRAASGITVVTIRNYDAYQAALLSEIDESGTAAAQQRHKEESIAKDVVVDGESAAAICKTDDVDEAVDWAKAVLIAKGDEPEGQNLITVVNQIPLWKERGITRAETIATVADIAGKAEKFRLSYYLAAILARGRRHRDKPPPADQPHLPLNPVVISSTERSHEQTSGNPPAATWQQSKDNWRVVHARRKAGWAAADTAPDHSGEDGGPPVRLLAAPGRG